MIRPKGFAMVPAVVAREAIARGGRTRLPEPMEMNEPGEVADFEAAGREGGPLVPVYELFARSTSRIMPTAAHVLDLGCGPAHHISYLATRRPDVTITGLDLAPNMLKAGRQTLKREGVAGRVKLVKGDMTSFADKFADERVNVVTSVFALHHLPTIDHLDACLKEIAKLRARTGCGVMLFDLCRLAHPASWRRFLAGAAPGLLATPDLERDSIASEAAAWSYDEMLLILADAGLADLKNRRSFPFAGFQMHWSPPRPAGWKDGDANWEGQPMPVTTRADVVPLRLMFGQI